MFEDIFKLMRGPWGIAAVLLLATEGGRRFLKKATKEAVRVGVVVADEAKVLIAEAREQAEDIAAEVRAERNDKVKHQSKNLAGSEKK